MSIHDQIRECLGLRDKKIAAGLDPNRPLLPTASIGRPWHVNPIINGQRFKPVPSLDEWIDGDFEFPSSATGIGYLLRRPDGPLPEGGLLRIVYTISGPADQLVGATNGTQYGVTGLFFIRRGDRGWSGLPPFEHATRFYSAGSWPLREAGTHVAEAQLLYSAWGGTSAKYPNTDQDVPAPTIEEFRAALADPEWVGLLFGDDTGRGHGTRATVPGIRCRIQSFVVLPSVAVLASA